MRRLRSGASAYRAICILMTALPEKCSIMTNFYSKAVIKMHLQKLLVIVSFSEHHVERCISVLKNLPKVGPLLQKPLKEWLVQQKEKLHRPVGAGAASQTPHRQSLVQILFEYFVVCFVAFFVVSLINSLAQNYHKRLFQRQKKKL
uniref:Uncharacterized protein n=2 Tax=Romanomermis culicivorax TaxID=13658 RepID=A0A915HX13_ROMCU